MVRIWDTFLYEGSKVLFRYAIAIFYYNQEALLSESNSIVIFNRLRSMCKEATDVRRLTEVSPSSSLPLLLSSTPPSPPPPFHFFFQIAFYEITRFSMDSIRKKRDFYHRQIKVNTLHRLCPFLMFF